MQWTPSVGSHFSFSKRGQRGNRLSKGSRQPKPYSEATHGWNTTRNVGRVVRLLRCRCRSASQRYDAHTGVDTNAAGTAVLVRNHAFSGTGAAGQAQDEDTSSYPASSKWTLHCLLPNDGQDRESRAQYPTLFH